MTVLLCHTNKTATIKKMILLISTMPYSQCSDKYYHAFNADTSFDLLCDWFNANKLTLSLNKSCYSVFGHVSKTTRNVCVNINNHIRSRVHTCKYLGIVTDKQCS